MNLYTNKLYLEDINLVADTSLPWDQLHNKAVFLSGATGLIGSFLVDVLMQNNTKGLNCTIYILGRSQQKAENRFSKWWGNNNLRFVSYDVNKPFVLDDIATVDYVLHLASHTHPMQYSTDPIGTIMTNIIGLQNMLEFASSHNATRIAFASSNEIYGENRKDADLFDESYCGFIDSNTLRAGYPESKRCGEALCQAYKAQKGLDIVISRFTRSYGPTMLLSDTKAISQFIRKGINNEDIVLKSAGTQYYSYTYMADAAYGLLTILLHGKNGEAYNIADEESNITLKDLAQLIADYVGKEVIFEIPDAVECAGYSKATKALLDGSKLKRIGWKPFYNIQNGIPRTIDILKDVMV